MQRLLFFSYFKGHLHVINSSLAFSLRFFSFLCMIGSWVLKTLITAGNTRTLKKIFKHICCFFYILVRIIKTEADKPWSDVLGHCVYNLEIKYISEVEMLIRFVVFYIFQLFGFKPTYF